MSWSQATAAAKQEPVRPSDAYSPWKNPVKYFGAAVSETPLAARFNKDKAAHPTMQPAQPHNDPIALSTPIGAPTPELYIYSAQMSEQKGEIGEARQQFQQALSMWPGHVEVLRAAARMEDRRGDLALAEQLYNQAVTSNPQHAGALNDLGLCLARQGKLEPSVQVIEQAIQLQPAKALYRNNAATVLVEMRQDQRALAHLAAVHGSAEANYNLGQLLVSRNRGSDAAPYFQAALEQNPSLQAAHVALANLQGSVSTAPTSAPQPTATVTPPTVAPQQSYPVGPQFGYPSTARTPDVGASSNMPRYLPPVASQPGAMHR
jgi:tetratricopeptide (TPR) repeat protein